MQDIDRSYLSQPEVVHASRKWTCIRLATYEDAQEARYLEGIFVGRSGQLENTVFALMNPEANQHLIRPGRGPRQLFRSPGEMAAEMDRLAREFAPKGRDRKELPKVESLRLALNVAACAGLPLIVVRSKQAEQALAEAAWSPQNLGRAVYVRTELPGSAQAYLLTPDKFGLEIETCRPFDPYIDAAQLSALLSAFRSEPKDHRQHVQEGFAKGIRWETRVPVTDPQARY